MNYNIINSIKTLSTTIENGDLKKIIIYLLFVFALHL